MNSDSAWQWVAPMPEQRTRLEAFLTPDGYIQVVGGILPLSIDRTSLSQNTNNPDYNNKPPDSERWLLTYDITHDRWKSTSINLNPASDLSRLHWNAAIICNVQGNFYWIGGAKKESDSTAQLLKIEQGESSAADSQGVSKILAELSPMLEAREQHRAVQTLDGKILVIGGGSNVSK